MRMTTTRPRCRAPLSPSPLKFLLPTLHPPPRVTPLRFNLLVLLPRGDVSGYKQFDNQLSMVNLGVCPRLIPFVDFCLLLLLFFYLLCQSSLVLPLSTPLGRAWSFSRTELPSNSGCAHQHAYELENDFVFGSLIAVGPPWDRATIDRGRSF